MKVGQLFTAAVVETSPCVNCGAPTVEIDGGAEHFEVAETGAKTAWRECRTIVRGRQKLTGTVAQIGQGIREHGQ